MSRPGRARPLLIHCAYHKCLTVYYKRVMQMLCGRLLPWSGGDGHFNSDIDAFYDGLGTFRVASVNNRALDLEWLAATRRGGFRISRFIRDPRDLVVSGYFYHRRGAEPWTMIESPTAEDWAFANGHVPAAVTAAGTSFAGYLQDVSEEEGLRAELDFRRFHFESMMRWPTDHPDILTFRYESILGQEAAVFDSIFRLYGVSLVERLLGGYLARRYAFKKVAASDPHVRNPTSGQWRERFTPALHEAFEAQHPGLIEHLGYDSAS